MEVVLIWFVKKMLKIKTKCGLDKKKVLETKKGFFARIRLYWFLIFGGFVIFIALKKRNNSKAN